MITDKKQIQELQFRSNLPRFFKEGIYLFAALEPEEQKLPKDEQIKLMIDAFKTIAEQEELLFNKPITSANELAYKIYSDENPDFEWLECIYETIGDVENYLWGEMKIYKGAFVYFVTGSLKSIEKPRIPNDFTRF
jgi:hypothetical protein